MVAPEFVKVAEEVGAALADGRPVVALESTLISHGMPYPDNAATGKALEAIVREAGATPATIALADGKIHVGIDAALLDRLTTAPDVAKVSRRDLAVTLARRSLGATTVAATMFAASAAGIRIFATGGIGGVHRGATETFDISTDLTELARSPVAVVSAGAKSILDLAKTTEFLETQGVPVLGYRTDEFPAFFARTSGHRLDHRLETPEAVAEVLDLHFRLDPGGGVLIANPIPEAHALPAEEIEAHIREAVREAEAAGIAHKALTPFLLDRVKALTGGRSLAANIALVKNNAALGASIAVLLAQRRRERHGRGAQTTRLMQPAPGVERKSRSVLVIGDVMRDVIVRPEGPPVRGADRRAAIRVVPGGSGANLAAWLVYAGLDAVIVGRVGRDDHARQVELFRGAGVVPVLAADADAPTGMLVALIDPDGERSFLTDRGANERLAREDLPDARLDSVDARPCLRLRPAGAGTTRGGARFSRTGGAPRRAGERRSRLAVAAGGGWPRQLPGMDGRRRDVLSQQRRGGGAGGHDGAAAAAGPPLPPLRHGRRQARRPRGRGRRPARRALRGAGAADAGRGHHRRGRRVSRRLPGVTPGWRRPRGEPRPRLRARGAGDDHPGRASSCRSPRIRMQSEKARAKLTP